MHSGKAPGPAPEWCTHGAAQAQLARAANLGSPLLSKLESIASSAVRAADKVGASLIIVYTQSGARERSARHRDRVSRAG
jgi:pyruvate kinase